MNQEFVLKQIEEKKKKSKKKMRMTDEEYRMNRNLIKAAEKV